MIDFNGGVVNDGWLCPDDESEPDLSQAEMDARAQDAKLNEEDEFDYGFDDQFEDKDYDAED